MADRKNEHLFYIFSAYQSFSGYSTLMGIRNQRGAPPLRIKYFFNKWVSISVKQMETSTAGKNRLLKTILKTRP
jgi:hypothetical protein